MSRKSSLAPESQAVITLLRERGPSSLAELLNHFPAGGRSGLRKRLSNLCDGNWIDIAWNADGEMLWLVAPRARAALPKPPQPASTPPVLVPPRRINVMAGTYRPPPLTPTRPGALDYQRCASHGVRC